MNSTGVFISHHSNSSINLVLELSNVLQAYEVEHWYAERDIKPMDNYTEVIPLVIEKSELLVLLLNKESNVSKQVLREVQCALRWKIPVMIARLDDCEESQSIAYIGSTAQYRDKTNLYVFSTQVEAEMLLAHAFNSADNDIKIKVRRVNEVQSLISRNLYENGHEKIFESAYDDGSGVSNKK